MFVATVVRGQQAATQPATPSVEPPVISSASGVLQVTPKWTGERMKDGRPKVSDDLLKRMRNVPITMAWSILMNAGYHNAYETAADWMIMRPDQALVGRALTAQYMPAHPDLNDAIMKQGKTEGRIGNSNSWPIDMLQKGDVYVADGFGKIVDGTLIGDNLANSIFAKSGTGVIFNAGVRDLEGIEEVEGFNVWHKGADPSYLKEVMLTGINVPIRIGRAVVCPGDIVLAKKEGIVFIPPHLAERVVTEAEAITLKDAFGHERLRAGKYTPGQIDSRWTPEIQADFREWLKQNRDKLTVPPEAIDRVLNSTMRNW
ncbi:MAG: RraA family protein [Acidobacteria bacterium]|nr:MAG: RraA family protein [Acidobacteriota bacterium]